MSAIRPEAERLVDLLFYPFTEGSLPMPAEGGRVLVLDAPGGFRTPRGFAADLSLAQDFKPSFDSLRQAGFDVAPAPSGEGYDVALVLLGRHRGLNERLLLEAASRLRANGMLVAAGYKTDGAASLLGRVRRHLTDLEHASKYHGVVFWIKVDATAKAALQGFASQKPPAMPDDRFQAAPGMFSHDRVDPGSRLLLQAIPPDVAGRIADFGAGWGYLSVGLAEKLPGLSDIDLYEASHSSLEAARANMERLAPAIPARFFWHDVAGEPVADRYDAVIMNPPFHQGRAAEPDLGRKFINAAQKALKPGGRVFLVANRGLPYEAVLASGFASTGEILRDGSYKVLWARR